MSLRRKRILAGGAVVSLVAAVIMLIATVGSASDTDADRPSPSDASYAQSVETSDGAGSYESTEPSDTIEVPELLGRDAHEAQLLLSAVGLVTEVVEDADLAGQGAEVVGAQDPQPGDLVYLGSVVTIFIPSDDAGANASALNGVVICLDPGHQSSSNLSPEPIGPGASETKESVRGGATGVATGIPEYEIALQIAMNTKQRLEDAGFTVVMTRTTNDVDISNARRAQVANEAGASLFVRIHADGSTDSSVAGISTLYPAANQWTSPITAESQRAAGLIQDGMVAATEARSRGIIARDDITGFNWAEVPAVLVECGFMSNPVEDRLLASPHYQDKVASGITDGVLAFVGR